jgi:putative DNA primase/helicase
MSAETIAKTLKGRKSGANWIARCPAHDDRKPSLSIRDADDGKVLVRCHAGCTQDSVLAALRQQGLWTVSGPNQSGGTASASVTNQKDRDDVAQRSSRALKRWQSTKPPYGTVVEKYLRSRGLDLPWLERIRFHPGLKHCSGEVWPAMVGLVTRGGDDVPLAIHRTFLARDGAGKAPVDPQKMMLGPCAFIARVFAFRATSRKPVP